MCKQRIAQKVHLPGGLSLEWAGEYDSLQKEQRRLAIIIPISLVIILALLFTAFNSLRHALLVLAILPFGAIGGVLSAADHAYAFQYFGGGGIRFGDRRVHAGRRGVRFRHSPERKGRAFDTRCDRAWAPGGDAAGDDGVRGGGTWIAARGGVLWSRRAGAAAPGARGGGRNGDFAAGDSVLDSGAGELLAPNPQRTRRASKRNIAADSNRLYRLR